MLKEVTLLLPNMSLIFLPKMNRISSQIQEPASIPSIPLVELLWKIILG